MSRKLTRRSFVKATSAAAVLVGAKSVLPAWGAKPTSASLATFSYSSVRLLDGPMKRQFDDHHSLFLHLDDDRLLKVFRQKAGLPAPGEDMGGWYDLEGFDLAKNDFHGFV